MFTEPPAPGHKVLCSLWSTDRKSARVHLCYLCIHVHRYRYVYVHLCVPASELAVQVNAHSLNEQLSSAAQSQIGGGGWCLGRDAKMDDQHRKMFSKGHAGFWGPVLG